MVEVIGRNPRSVGPWKIPPQWLSSGGLIQSLVPKELRP